MYLISTHRSHVYQYAYYPAGKKNTQLLTSLHHETKETMSENGEWLEHYYGNTLEDQYNDELPDTTSVDEMKQMKEVSSMQKERLTPRYVSSAALP